ncbi:MAG: N-acetyltransferase [Candidatus Sumerlaeia bacterium]|nr:N-acetyltransferase [Candidatus Sumerlaeia bacterium]
MSSAEPIRIVEAHSSGDVQEFIEFPFRQHAPNPYWISPPREHYKTLLNTLKHPFHEHASVAYFLARRGSEVVGRIAAIENYAHNSFHNEKVGFFGFFDAINDPEVFKKLLEAASEWLRRRGLTILRGPCSFSTNEECGLLVSGFAVDPSIMTPYNPRYYTECYEHLGLRKAEDLICWHMDVQSYPQRLIDLTDSSIKRLERAGKKVHIRNLNLKDFENELNRVIKIYNTAWEKNWGFIPLTENEIRFTAKELKMLVDPDLVLFVEVDGEPAAFSFGIPDYNEVLRYSKGYQWGWRMIASFAFIRPMIRKFRLLMMGTLPEFRNRGFELMMYTKTREILMRKGYMGGELSWILERNANMNNSLKGINAIESRRYRLFEKDL